MTISQETHDNLRRVELLALIAACEECECPPGCYCSKNLQWAEQKLAALKERRIHQQQTLGGDHNG